MRSATRPLTAGAAGLAHSTRLPSPPLTRGLRVSAHTLEHPTPASVEAHLSTLPANSTLLFTLSTSIPAHSLDPLVTVLNSASSQASVGSFHQSATHIPELAIAAFTPDSAEERVVPFYSAASGRAPASVGRWHRTDEPDWPEDERGNAVGELEGVLAGKGWEGVWAARGDEASVELGQGIQSIVALTDGTPQPVLRALGAYNAMTTGLVATATPFLTGRPHTLFHGGQTYSTGTVGLGLSRPSSASIEYGLEPLDVPVKVASARGNMLIRFDGPIPNPTQTLIAALQRRDGGKRSGITKDEEFYLAIMEPGSPTPRTVRILSGDPSRGAISLEMEQPLFPGQFVQFMYRPSSSSPPIPLADALRFAVLPRTDEVAPAATPEGAPRTLPGFLAASEGGIIFGTAPGVNTVAGAVMSVKW